MNDIKDIVNVYQNDIKHVCEVADEIASCSTKRPKPFTSAMNTIAASSSAVNKQTDHVPALMSTEYLLLAENKGCYKCCCFFVKHQLSSCPNGYPSPKDYCTLTADMVLRARKAHTNTVLPSTCMGTSSKVAAITSAPPTPERNVIAAVLDDENSDTVDWASSSEEEDANIQVSDYCTSHLNLKCFVHGTNHHSIIVNTFLDNGTYLVLIHPNVVRQLKLRIRKLPHPKCFNAALQSSEHNQKTCATEFIYLHISTMNHTWTSKKVIALISPSLNMPALLGLPFLEKNNLVIDHGLCTCVVCGTNLNLLKSDSVVLPSHINTLSCSPQDVIKTAKLNVIGELSQVCQYHHQLNAGCFETCSDTALTRNLIDAVIAKLDVCK